MTLDPRTRLAKSAEHLNGKSETSEPSSSPLDARTSNPSRAETAKRRKLNALTEALFDPFTTMQEADLEALMLAAKQRKIARPISPRFRLP